MSQNNKPRRQSQKSAQITHKNTSEEERKAIQSIAKDKTIKVLAADNGRTSYHGQRTVGFVMEDLEAKAIATAPTECRLSLWREYANDILEKIKSGRTHRLTDTHRPTHHLSTTDQTGNRQPEKFTHAEEEHRFIALNLEHHIEDGSVKIKNIHKTNTHRPALTMDIRSPHSTQDISGLHLI